MLNQFEIKLENICFFLQNNGYPESAINISIRQKTACVNSKLKEAPKGCPVYLKLFWTGKIFLKLGNQIKMTNSKAIMQLNLVSFFCEKNATSNSLRFMRILAMISEEC